MSLFTPGKAGVMPPLVARSLTRNSSRNKALAENHLNGVPIRVHRGQAHVSGYAGGIFDIGMTAFTTSRATGKKPAKTALGFGVFVSRKP